MGKELSLFFLITGIVLVFLSLMRSPVLTGAVIGTNVESKLVGVLGILFMLCAIIIDRYRI